MSRIRTISIGHFVPAGLLAIAFELMATPAGAQAVQASQDTFTGAAKISVDYANAFSSYYTIAQAAVALAQAMGFFDDTTKRFSLNCRPCMIK